MDEKKSPDVPSDASEAPKIKEVKDMEEYLEALNTAGPKLVVADFMAKWCGPCHRMSPVLDSLSSKYPDVVFLKVDVDQCKDVQDVENISAMPTFVFYKGKSKVDYLTGADPNALETKIKKHAVELEGAGDEAAPPGQSRSQLSPFSIQHDLVVYLNKAECECLNDDDEHPWLNMMTSEERFCLSDCDEQMILTLSFATHVKLHSMAIQAPADSGPQVVKLFANMTRPLDFDSACKTVPTQEIKFTPEDLGTGKTIQLKFVKFQNLANLTIFFEDNVGNAEQTRIDRLKLLGQPLQTTQMEEFKRIAGKKGEAH